MSPETGQQCPPLIVIETVLLIPGENTRLLMFCWWLHVGNKRLFFSLRHTEHCQTCKPKNRHVMQ